MICKQRADAPLCQARRVTLDKVETITAFAKDMSEYLKASELTESRASIRSFVKEIPLSRLSLCEDKAVHSLCKFTKLPSERSTQGGQGSHPDDLER